MKKSLSKKNIQRSYSDESSDDDISDSYQDSLISSIKALSHKESEKKKEVATPTNSRIEFVKNILDGAELKGMIDFDACDTESSKDTRLHKRIMDVTELFSSMRVTLKYLKSGTTGHTFKAISRDNNNVAFAVKVCAYPIDEYGPIKSASRPENVELRMLKLLSYFVLNKATPHFVLPIGTFNTSIAHFIKVPENMINLNDRKNDLYKKFIEKYKKGEFHDFVSILISEWCNGGDLLDYIRHNYQNMNLRTWTVIIFQLLYTLTLVHQKYPAFRHNDMKANNILVQLIDIPKSQEDRRYKYSLDPNFFVIPHIGLIIKIWDFDFSSIDGFIDNKKVNAKWTSKMNISSKKNQYYDIHYFFNTLIHEKFFPQFYKGGAPKEIVDFVHRIIPENYRGVSTLEGANVNKKGRIQVDVEYTTPYNVIMKDKLFEKYRFTQP